jgi:predicted SnoaL-like aldol condensation-catalyzing enzyme
MNRKGNKEKAIEFYRKAFEGDPKKAVSLFVGDRYIQHNPSVEDGTRGFISYFEKMHREYPGKSIEFVRAVEEGDLVALHTHQLWPEQEEYVTMDFFRFNSLGKIVEHWDAIQQIPVEAANSNGMY